MNDFSFFSLFSRVCVHALMCVCEVCVRLCACACVCVSADTSKGNTRNNKAAQVFAPRCDSNNEGGTDVRDCAN